MASLTSIQEFAGAQANRHITFGDLAGQFPSNVAHSWMIYFRETSGDSGTFQYLLAKCNSGGEGARVFTDSTGGSGRYGLQSSGSTLAPSRATTAVYTQAQWHCMVVTYDATGALGNDIRIFHSLNGGSFVEATYNTTTDGSGTINADATDSFVIGNRVSVDRGFAGRLAYVARFNVAITSAAQAQQIFDDGPLGEESCEFLWANGADLVGGKTPTSTGSGVTTDTNSANFPPNTNLGTSSGVTGVITASQASQTSDASGTVTAPSVTGAVTATQAAQTSELSGAFGIDYTGSIVATQASQTSDASGTFTPALATTTLEALFAGANANLTLSSITNASTANPTATIRVRSPEDAEWQQALYKLVGTASKIITNEILLTEKEDGDNYLGTYQGPWYSFDGITWTNQSSWSQVAGDRMTFNIDCGSNNEVWVATVPPWTQDTVLPWISALAAAHPTRIKSNLASHIAHGGDPYVCGLSGTGTDENGRSVSNLPLISFVIEDNALGVPAQKKWIELWAGTHPGEWNGGAQMKGAVNAILNGANSTELLTRFSFVVRPIMSPKGSRLGFRRNEAASSFINNLDANREWDDGDTSLATVVQWQGILDVDHSVNHGNKVKGFFDFHDGKHTSDIAWFYYQTGSTIHTAYEAILQAINPEINAVSSVLANGTTVHYWLSKGLQFAWTCEVADEKSTYAQLEAIGAAYMNSLIAADDAEMLGPSSTVVTGAITASQAAQTADASATFVPQSVTGVITATQAAQTADGVAIATPPVVNGAITAMQASQSSDAAGIFSPSGDVIGVIVASQAAQTVTATGTVVSPAVTGVITAAQAAQVSNGVGFVLGEQISLPLNRALCLNFARKTFVSFERD